MYIEKFRGFKWIRRWNIEEEGVECAEMQQTKAG